MIDNFAIVRERILQFDYEGECYMILVLRRRKDVKGRVVEGVNEDNRLIKHFFVYDKEYFDRKREAIIALCEQNNARAYILPQRRTCRLVLWNLHDKVSDTLKSGTMNVHFDHLIRTCVAGMHETPVDAKWHKRWVIDIDGDNEDTLNLLKVWEGREEGMFDVGSYATWLANRISKALQPIDRPEDAVAYMPSLKTYFLPSVVTVMRTPHGYHIVTPPFNRDQKSMEKYFGKGCPRQDWIKPDAMALLYSPTIISNGEE